MLFGWGLWYTIQVLFSDTNWIRLRRWNVHFSVRFLLYFPPMISHEHGLSGWWEQRYYQPGYHIMKYNNTIL